MGDKNAPQSLPHKLFSPRHRMKLLLPFCLLVVGIVWSSANLLPFNSVAESRFYLRQCATCGLDGALQGDQLDGVGASTTLQLQESLNVQDGRDQQAHTRSQLGAAGRNSRYGSDFANAMQPGRVPRKKLVKEAPIVDEGVVAMVDSALDEELEEDSQPDKPPQMEEVDILRTELSSALMQSERRSHGGDTRITGDLQMDGNMYALRILDEIRSYSAPFNAEINATSSSSTTKDSSCQGKYIYLYDLPPEFNFDLVKRCDNLLPGFDLCDYFDNSGFGKPVAAGKSNDSQILQPPSRWFNTHQYSLELVSHARILKYQCRTQDPSKASLFYIPYYGGLDVIRWHWALNATNEKRDALGRRLVRWLEQQPSWNRREGVDHVLVLGKISWDFRRQVTGTWGSRLLEFPEMQKVTKLLIERNPWHRQDIGVPHPTFFHPKSASDMRRWLSHVESQTRKNLVSFVGKDRHLDPNNVRSALIGQCRDATGTNDCHFLECEQDKCLLPDYVIKVFLTSHFCMQPPGDSPTRRSVFDSLVAGCIPVLFHPSTAYLQYPWHLPRNASSWSVYVSETDVKSGKVNVVEVLKRISHQERAAMQSVIKSIIPRLVYAEPGADMAPFKDAFDMVLENLLYRASHSPDDLKQN
ncbi:hypothetical protein M758_7G074500 [Ceratodon purpureus]|uniref:Exostosin GT47 domain-containing protein n=1 Tax=Ceratodon purpureus TaxID=3225 RepID=A0A8T0H5E6_CERPU|nr:hypothetical protein KC19_7G069900 [Ceratodon purpureus]KAG0610549.1 hypothetical protein M758_7G074500 [Ceratodon purpureus]